MSELRRVDEDTWVAPDAWWAKADRFRGRGPVRPVRPSKKARTSSRTETDPKVVRPVLEATAAMGFEDIAAAGLAVVAGTGATPLGVAALTVITDAWVTSGSSSWGQDTTTIPDGWVARYGVVFAAEAAALTAGLHLAHPTDGTKHLSRIDAEGLLRSGVMDLLRRVRAHLAATSDDEYAGAVAHLDRYRSDPGTLSVRLTTSYLLPTEQHWYDADLRAIAGKRTRYDYFWPQLAHSATTVEQIERLGADYRTGTPFWSPDDPLYSAVVNIGPETAGLIAATMDAERQDAENRRALAGMLAHFPTDAAFGALLDRAATVRGPLYEAAQRFPRRALRMLAASESGDPIASDLSRALARLHPDLAAELDIPVEPLTSSVPLEGISTRDELPEFLRLPPWERGLAASEQVVIAGLGGTGPVRVSWQPGERDGWQAIPSRWDDHARDWQSYADEILAEPDKRRWLRSHLFADAPRELIASRLDALHESDIRDDSRAARRILARFEGDVAQRIVEAAQHNPAYMTEVLLPLTGTAVTRLMVERLPVRRARTTVLDWFRRHIDTAAIDLVAAALDSPGKHRTLAWEAVHTLVAAGYREELLTAAATYGDHVAAAFESELTADPLSRLPSRIPALPTWLLPTALPALVLRENRRALPADAVASVCIMLAMRGPTGHYAGAIRVKEIAEPHSLAEFAWALLDGWRQVGYPAADGWILHALSLFGDDDTARRLTSLIRIWPGESAHQRAVTGLDVLAEIGTDIALMQLNGIAERVKFKGIKAKAQEKIQQIAEQRELTAEQLADRLVPPLGLSADGTLLLDYGPRAFRIGFDEALTPTVSDADGTPRKSLPKPGAKDDPALGPLAYKAFSALRKDVKTIARDQIQRMELAMVKGRRWTVAEHRQLFVEHPLLWHLTRRIVWATFDNTGVSHAFRVAEDRSLADVRDERYTPADGLLVGIAHPLQLGEELGAWLEVFADYELLQPFPQLTRDTYALTEDEATAVDLTRFTGIKVPPTTVQGMTSRGWERQSPQGGGNSYCFYRVLSQDHSVIVDIYPGLGIGMPPADHDPQALEHIHLGVPGQEYTYAYRTASTPFGVLDAVTASEILRDLEHLTR